VRGVPSHGTSRRWEGIGDVFAVFAPRFDQ
jgi:hypothetical protein